VALEVDDLNYKFQKHSHKSPLRKCLVRSLSSKIECYYPSYSVGNSKVALEEYGSLKPLETLGADARINPEEWVESLLSMTCKRGLFW
jgi:hypothetical protein